ncbi:MAG TPA: site-2 protease family protein [Lacunisphaera sp.]|nr:site-2 protease family protein [Lacunisphaera sp.]
MTEPAPPGEPTPLRVDPPKPTLASRFKTVLAPVGAGLLLVAKFFAKLKFLLLPALKFLPMILKTGGTMLLSIWFYALTWGWWYAAGFIGLILVHECGHLVVARRFGLNAGVPVFIPFMGAFIALKDAPKDAWIEACVGIGGPLFGAAGALACEGIHRATGQELFRALAYSGFFLNLFNLAPVTPLDGGRIAAALSPWLWVVGLGVIGWMAFIHPNLILFAILLMALPRVWLLFRGRSEVEKRYFEVAPARRWTMGVTYFGLVVALVLGMRSTHIPPQPRPPAYVSSVR